MNAIANALHKAGYDVGRDALYTAASKAFAESKGNPKQAARLLVGETAKDTKLLFALAHYFIQTVIAADARGPSTSSARGGLSVGALSSQGKLAPSRGPIETSRAVVGLPSGQIGSAPLVSPSDAPVAKKTMPSGSLDAAVGASSVSAREANVRVPNGRASVALRAEPLHGRLSQPGLASSPASSAKPVVNPPRGLAAITAVNKTLSSFDTFKVRGTPIGDLTVGQAKHMAFTNEAEARVVRELLGRVSNPEAGVALREIMRVEWLDEAIAGIWRKASA